MTKKKATPKKATKKKSDALVKREKLQALMDKAEEMRESNKYLIQEVRKDPTLAEEVKDLLCADLRRVAEIPREILGPSASQKRYREHGHYSESLVPYLFGTWAEFKRKAGIDPSLGSRKVLLNISKTARAQDVMKYAERYVKPWDDAYSSLDMQQECVTGVIASDFHSKFIDPFARRVFMEVVEAEQPDFGRFNGDGPDFPTLSRHRQLPGHFALTVQDEVSCWKGFMADTRERAPYADLKWILGNHDIRLITALADAAPMFCSLESLEFNQLFGLDELEVGLVARSSFLNPSARAKKTDIAQNWETLPDAYGNPFWTTVHGFLAGKNAPADHMRRFMTNGTNGHLHNPLTLTGGSLATGVLQWAQTGCMGYPPAIAAGYLPGPVDFHGWMSTFILVRLFPRHRQVSITPVTVGEHIAEHGGYLWEITPEEQAQRQAMMEI